MNLPNIYTRYCTAVLVAMIVTPMLAGSAQAYVGPGLGAGAIAVVLGLVGSLFLAVFAIFWYPLKRLFKKSGRVTSDQETGSKD